MGAGVYRTDTEGLVMSEYEGNEYIIPPSLVPGLDIGGSAKDRGARQGSSYRYVPGQRVVLLDNGAYRDVTIVDAEQAMATVTADARTGKSESMYVAITQLTDTIAPTTSDPAMHAIFDAAYIHEAPTTPVRTRMIDVRVTVRDRGDATITYGGLIYIDYQMLWGPEFTVTTERTWDGGVQE